MAVKPVLPTPPLSGTGLPTDPLYATITSEPPEPPFPVARPTSYDFGTPGNPQWYYALEIAYATLEGKIQVPTGGVTLATAGLDYLGNAITLSPSSKVCVLLDTHLPYTAITVTWSCARWGVKPTAPSPRSVNPDWVLLSHAVSPKPGAFQTDLNTRIFWITGVYQYASQVPAEAGLTPLTTGNLPFDLNIAEQNTYTPNDFSKVILDPKRLVIGGKPVVNPVWASGKPVLQP